MEKININCDDVVIGSRTVSEYKMQILNFLNLLWIEIEKVRNKNASLGSTDSWVNNLIFYIRLIMELTNDNDYTSYDKLHSTIESLRYKIKNREPKKSCMECWYTTLSIVTEKFDLKYTLN